MQFNGQIESDFLKILKVEDVDKQKLIDYASTDFLNLRMALVNYIKSVYPLDYNYFAESDLGMMLVELVAYMGHVLSYKADYLANENYLKTARSRKSVKKLLQLIGVRMKGPISAAADAKITLAQSIAWGDTDPLTIYPASRVITVTSPEDGLPISYTLYKVASNGDIDVPNSTGNLIIYGSEKDSNTVASNLVLLEGNLVIQTGTFVDTESTKSVRLSESPVVEGSIQVFITGNAATSGAYTQVENTFFASGADSKVFQLISNDNYGGTIVFGDNNLGKLPAIGDSYTVQYRTGGGTRGNIIKSLINTSIQTSFNNQVINATLENTSVGTGGVDAETIDHAKRYAPQMFRSQSRLVTLNDFKAFANSYITSYGAIGKATAVTRRAYSSANIVDIYVLERASNLQLRKSTPEFKRQLVEAMNQYKMLTDEIIVVDGLIRSIDLVITVRVDSKYQTREDTIKNKINRKIITHFDVDNNDFGKEFNPQDLMHSLFEVDEVRFATIDNVPEPIKMAFNEIIQLNNFSVNIVYV